MGHHIKYRIDKILQIQKILVDQKYNAVLKEEVFKFVNRILYSLLPKLKDNIDDITIENNRMIGPEELTIATDKEKKIIFEDISEINLKEKFDLNKYIITSVKVKNCEISNAWNENKLIYDRSTIRDQKIRLLVIKSKFKTPDNFSFFGTWIR